MDKQTSQQRPAHLQPARGMRHPTKMNRMAKMLARLHMHLLRKNWVPAMSEKALALTTVGRKSGKSHSVAVRYVQDADGFYAMTPGGASDWYKNLLKTPEGLLEVKGQRIPIRATPIDSPAERRRLFELFKRHHQDAFAHIFEVSLDASPEQLEPALAARQFMHFKPS